MKQENVNENKEKRFIFIVGGIRFENRNYNNEYVLLIMRFKNPSEDPSTGKNIYHTNFNNCKLEQSGSTC